MIKKAEKAALKFKSNFRADVDFYDYVRYISGEGYKVYFIGTTDGDRALQRLGLTEIAEIRRSFTYDTPSEKAIFIDRNLSSHDKLHSLLHEIGHIVLGHTEIFKNIYEDDESKEVEANAFAETVLENDGDSKFPALFSLFVSICTAVLVFTAVVFVWFFDDYKQFGHSETNFESAVVDNSAVNAISGAESDAGVVYINPGSDVYHRKFCKYAENGIKVNIDEVKNGFDPCYFCNP